jgi:hypothetical protein
LAVAPYSSLIAAGAKILAVYTVYNLVTNDDFVGLWLSSGLNPAELAILDFEALLSTPQQLARFPGALTDLVERVSETGSEEERLAAWFESKNDPMKYINEVIDKRVSGSILQARK